jgi:potassium-dependent mechanosensitive channel
MRTFFRAPVLAALAAAVAVVAGAQPLGPQEPPAAARAAEPAPRSAYPTPAELAAAARSTRDSVAIALEEIERLADVDGLRASLSAAQVRQRELTGILETMRPLEHTRPERLFRLRNEALAHQTRLDGIAERISERVGALGTLRGAWRERLEIWTAWREAAPARPELAAQLPEIERTVERIEPVLARSDEVAPELASLGETAERLRVGTRELLEQTAALRAGRREALLRADRPLLLSPEHRAALRDPGAWHPGEAVRPETLSAFVRDHALLLVVHLLLTLLLALLALRMRPHAAPEREWSGMLRHPWAVAVFAATAFLARRYILAPPVWDVVSWSLLAGSGAVLAGTLLRGRALRLMIASVAAVYPLVLLAEALRVPDPYFRLALAAIAAAAVIGFPMLAARADAATPVGRRARWVLGVATALSAAVLATQLLGFDQLSRWLVHATLTSAYVAFSIAFLLVVARGALRTLLRKEFVGRARMVGTVAVPLVERVVAVLQVVLVVAGALVLLDVWELAPSPVETWGRVVGWGFTVAGLQVTVGRILFAGVLVYLAATASWLARAVVSARVTHGWGVERGVAESINALVHYAVITLGVLLALGALGMELQNFAIVAGALGVGIGFGLQNVVNNFVSGLILLFERPVRVGDTVEIGEEWGTIKKIGLRSTVVVTFSQSELIVPNGDLVSEKVTNWTLSNPVTRLAIPVGVAYGSDVQMVLQILVEAAPAHPAVVEEPAPVALFTGFGDSSLDFEVRVWVREIAARLPAKSAVLAEIDRRFREEGIEIPFPQRDLHLRSVDAKAARALVPPHDPGPE